MPYLFTSCSLHIMCITSETYCVVFRCPLAPAYQGSNESFISTVSSLDDQRHHLLLDEVPAVSYPSLSNIHTPLSSSPHSHLILAARNFPWIPLSSIILVTVHVPFVTHNDQRIILITAVYIFFSKLESVKLFS